VAAVPGAMLDAESIQAKALDAARAGQRSITVDVGTVSVPPHVPPAEVDALLADAERMGDQRLGIYVGDKSVTVDGSKIRTWLSSAVTADGTGLELRVDQEKIEED